MSGANGLFLLAGLGNGTFALPLMTTLPVSTHSPRAIATGSLNGDGQDDVAIVCQGQLGAFVPELVSFLGQPDGTLGAVATTTLYTSIGGRELYLHDLDGNGTEDVVYGGAVLLGLGDGGLAPVQAQAVFGGLSA